MPRLLTTTMRQRQNGAALIVSLVLLLIMTLIGLAAVETVTMQSQMAINSQMRLDVFQVALTNIDSHLYDPMRTNTPSATMFEANALPNTVVNFPAKDAIPTAPSGMNVTMSMTGSGITKQDCGASQFGFKRAQFELNSKAVVSGTGSTSDQYQGFYFCIKQ